MNVKEWERSDPFNLLARETSIYTFTYLNPKIVLRVTALVSKLWNEISQDEMLWRCFTLERFGWPTKLKEGIKWKDQYYNNVKRMQGNMTRQCGMLYSVYENKIEKWPDAEDVDVTSNSRLNCLHLSEDAEGIFHFILGFENGNIEFWKEEDDDGQQRNYTCMSLPRGHTEGVTCLKHFENYYGGDVSSTLFSASKDKTIRIWNLGPSKEICSKGIVLMESLKQFMTKNLKEKNVDNSLEGITALEVVNDDHIWKIFSGNDQGNITFHAISSIQSVVITQNNLVVRRAHDKLITSLIASNNKEILLSSSLDGTIKTWWIKETKEAVCLQTINAHSPVLKVIFHPDATVFIGLCMDNKIKLWTINSDKKLFFLKQDYQYYYHAEIESGAQSDAKHIAFYPFDDVKLLRCGFFQILCINRDNSIHMWDYIFASGSLEMVNFEDHQDKMNRTSG